MADARDGNRTIFIAGGGITGISAAVEAAEAGFPVVLVERDPWLGGRVARMNKYFPKLCPPQCGLEINFRRIRNNPLIRILTMAEVEQIDGIAGNFDVHIRVRPRYVNEQCTACGRCEAVAVTETANDFDYGMSRVRAAHLPHEFAFPLRYMITPLVVGTPEAEAIKSACPCGAVDMEMRPQTERIKAGAIIWATGWRPFDAAALSYYGGGTYRNVIANVTMERLASSNGPTRGKIERPSDGRPVKRVAFVQCAGSRDENHLPYCSGVCCLASLKQASYLLDQDPEARVSIFFIDMRTPGRNEAFLTRIREDDRVTLIKGKAGEIREAPQTGMVTVQAEDQATGKILQEEFDLVVLATGMIPSTTGGDAPVGITCDEHGFFASEGQKAGIIGAGCVRRPADVASCVQDATAAVLRAIQVIRR